MLDIRLFRENPDLVRKAVSDRHDTAPVDEILALDVKRRQKVSDLDNLRQERNAIAKDREKARLQPTENLGCRFGQTGLGFGMQDLCETPQ